MANIGDYTTAAAITALVRSCLEGISDDQLVVIGVDDGELFLSPPNQEVTALIIFTKNLGLLVPDLDPTAGISFGICREPFMVEVDVVDEFSLTRLLCQSLNDEVIDVLLVTPTKSIPYWQQLNQAPASPGRGMQKGGKRLKAEKHRLS